MSLYTDEEFPKLDINHLINILPFIQEKWQLIGIKLAVPTDILDRICEEADKEQIPQESIKTFCCIKMLTYWFQNGDNVSADTIINIIKVPHVGLKDKISVIKDILTSQQFDSSKIQKKFATSPPGDHEAPYVDMKTNICKELNNSQCSLNDVLLYLENSNIDPFVIKNISSFPDLFKSFEAHGLMHKGEPGWLKAIAKHVKCEKALEIIENYSALLIADKTICSHDSFSKIKNGFVVKFSDKDLEKSTIKDCSNAKSTVSSIVGLNETAGTLDSAEVGSLTFYWKVKESTTITIPKFINASLIKKCKDAGITHIGTIANGKVQLVAISELEIDKFTGK